MKALLHLMNSGQVKYNDPYFRFFAAVGSAQFIVTLLEEASWIELLKEKPYYIAMGVGVVVALLLIYSVYRVSIWLDVHYPWPRNVLKRLLLQILLGLVTPTLIGVLAISIYYLAMGTSMSQTRYVDVLLKIKILLLILTNVYYIGLFLFKALKMRIAHKDKLASFLELPAEPQALLAKDRLSASEEDEVVLIAEQLNAGSEDLPLLAFEDVVDVPPVIMDAEELLQLPPGWQIDHLCLVLSENRDAKVYHREELIMPWTRRIKDTMTLLSTKDFFKINKSCIVRRENILRAFYATDKRNINLLLNYPYRKMVTVGRFQRIRFEKWYELEIHLSEN